MIRPENLVFVFTMAALSVCWSVIPVEAARQFEATVTISAMEATGSNGFTVTVGRVLDITNGTPKLPSTLRLEAPNELRAFANVVGPGVFVTGPAPRPGETVRVYGAIEGEKTLAISAVEIKQVSQQRPWRLWWVRTHYDVSSDDVAAYGIAALLIGQEARKGVSVPLVWVLSNAGFVDFYSDSKRAAQTIEKYGLPAQKGCAPVLTKFINGTSRRTPVLIGGTPFMPTDGGADIVGGWWGLFPELIYRRAGEKLTLAVDCRRESAGQAVR